jgi:hypothetical protein
MRMRLSPVNTVVGSTWSRSLLDMNTQLGHQRRPLCPCLLACTATTLAISPAQVHRSLMPRIWESWTLPLVRRLPQQSLSPRQPLHQQQIGDLGPLLTLSNGPSTLTTPVGRRWARSSGSDRRARGPSAATTRASPQLARPRKRRKARSRIAARTRDEEYRSYHHLQPK